MCPHLIQCATNCSNILLLYSCVTKALLLKIPKFYKFLFMKNLCFEILGMDSSGNAAIQVFFDQRNFLTIILLSLYLLFNVLFGQNMNLSNMPSYKYKPIFSLLKCSLVFGAHSNSIPLPLSVSPPPASFNYYTLPAFNAQNATKRGEN